MQKDLEAGLTGRDIILKSRQLGATTYFCLRDLDAVAWNSNTWACILAHERQALDIIFSKIQIAWDNIDPLVKEQFLSQPKTDNKNELYWRDRNSKIYVALEVQGGTNHIVHFSEYAQIDEKRIATTIPTVPTDGVIVIESTPRGMGNRFYREWLDASRNENQYAPHFYPWWWDADEYRLPIKTVTTGNLTTEERNLIDLHGLDLEQVEWRRDQWKKQQQSDGSNLFLQEYPEDDISCFLSSGDAAFDNTALERIRHLLVKTPPPFLKGYLVEKSEENRFGRGSRRAN